MEEEKFTPDEQSDKPLSNEEILERSRKENSKLGDERERSILSTRGIIASTIGGFIVLLIIYIAYFFIYKRSCYELLAIPFITSGIANICQGAIFKKRKKIWWLFILFGAIQVVIAMLNLIMGLLQSGGF